MEYYPNLLIRFFKKRRFLLELELEMSLLRPFVALIAFIIMTGSSSSQEVPPDYSKEAKQILACYGAGNDTPNRLYACSGLWVTQRVLSLCFLDSGCPAVSGVSYDRQTVVSEIGGEEKLDAKILIDFKTVLAVPDWTIIDSCRASSAHERLFELCATQKMVGSTLQPLLKCGEEKAPDARARCLIDTAPNEVREAVGCIVGGGVSVDTVQKCAPKQNWGKVKDVTDCVNEAIQGDGKVRCLLGGFDPAQVAVSQCLSNTGDDRIKAFECLGKLDAEGAKLIGSAACAAQGPADPPALMACFSTSLPKDAGQIATCVGGDRAKIASCLLSIDRRYEPIAQSLSCVTGGRDASSLVANCSNLLIRDEKTRLIMACATKAGTDAVQLTGCASTTVFPPGIARYVGCAASSQGGPTAFAICAAGPVMNEEWRITAECAVESGGNPVGFAGCTAGKMTVRELTKCFTGGSCFGPNNTIVRIFSTVFHDALGNFGPNNDFVVALSHLKDLTGGPHSVINDPAQIFGGENSVFRNPGQLAGGPNSVVNQIITKPFGGDHSVPNDIARAVGQVAGEAGKVLDQGAKAAGDGVKAAGEGLKHLGTEIVKQLPPLPKLPKLPKL